LIQEFLQVPEIPVIPEHPVLRRVLESQQYPYFPEFQRLPYHQKVLVFLLVRQVQ